MVSERGGGFSKFIMQFGFIKKELEKCKKLRRMIFHMILFRASQEELASYW